MLIPLNAVFLCVTLIQIEELSCSEDIEQEVSQSEAYER